MCKLEEKNKSCCGSSHLVNQSILLKEHWDKAYLKSPESKLGWYEEDFSNSFRLLDQCELNSSDPVLLVGSGTSRLPDHMLNRGISKLWVLDISEVAIQEVKHRLGEKLNYRVGDILQPETMVDIPQVQLWFDRAVLHFFTKKEDQDKYFIQLKEKVNIGGYVIFAEFSLDGAEKCSGLPVLRYNQTMYQDCLGDEFKLLDSFDHTYYMPSGDPRPYNYSLYQRLA